MHRHDNHLRPAILSTAVLGSAKDLECDDTSAQAPIVLNSEPPTVAVNKPPSPHPPAALPSRVPSTGRRRLRLSCVELPALAEFRSGFDRKSKFANRKSPRSKAIAFQSQS